MISVFGSIVGKEEISAVSSVMESQWMGFGKKVDEFEQAFRERLKLKNFLMVDNGSNALYMAVVLLNLPLGSEVILPSFTWISCASSIIIAGRKPIFCDVDIDTMNVTRETIEPHITNKTGAIMVVHYAGLPVDMNSIMELGYPVIEDAAHAVDSKYRGKSCGSIGTVGIYSFDAVKNLTACDGGGITSNNEDMIDRAKILRYCGIGKSGFESISSNDKWWEYNINECFIKMLPNNVTASIATEQLKKLDVLQSIRKRIWDRYQEAFHNLDYLKTPIDAENNDRHSYFTYAIRVFKHRNKLAKFLLENDIYTTLRYHPLHLNSIFNDCKYLKNSEILNNECLSLPIHPRLTDENVEYIINKVKEFYDKGKHKNNDV
jgi:dTDP-4-amino-4,6-dideoxygalactose transaminase